MGICGIKAWKYLPGMRWTCLLTSCPQRYVVMSWKSGTSSSTFTISGLTGWKAYKSCAKCQKNVEKSFFVNAEKWACWIRCFGFPEADLKPPKKQNAPERRKQ